jgi:hypothetical protein
MGLTDFEPERLVRTGGKQSPVDPPVGEVLLHEGRSEGTGCINRRPGNAAPRMSMVMVKPIARGAIASGPRGSTTVPKMTMTRKNIISTSMITASMMETSRPSPGSPRWPGFRAFPSAGWPSGNGIDEPGVDVVRPFAGRPSQREKVMSPAAPCSTRVVPNRV